MKPKTRTVTRKAWGFWIPARGYLATDMCPNRAAARRNTMPDEVVVRLTITAEVPLSPKGGRR
jgi:hypothetical protein